MEAEKKAKLIALIKFGLLIILIVGIPMLIYFAAPAVTYYLRNIDEFDALLVQYAEKGVLIYLAAQILQVLIAVIPGEVVQIAGGYVYGVWGGLLLSLIGIGIGSFLAFRLARFLGRDAVSLFVKEESLAKVEHYFRGVKGGVTVFGLFLIPGMPKDTLVYAAGLSGINEWRFYWLSMLGRIPALIGTMLMGSLLQDRQIKLLIVLAVVFLLIFILCVIFRERLFNLLDALRTKIKHK